MGGEKRGAMKNFSSLVRERLASQQRQTGDHPEANLLIAFAERRVSRREHAAILTHLAECPECREVLALSSGASQDEAPSSRDFAKKGPTWWGWRLAATAVVICAVVAGVWGPSLFKGWPAGGASSQPIAVSRPPYVPAPLTAKAVEQAPTKPTMRASRKKRDSPRGDAAMLAERSGKPSLPQVVNEAEKSSEPASVVAGQTAAPAALPTPAVAAAQASRAVRATSSNDLLVPNSMFGVSGGAIRLQKSVRAPSTDEKSVWSLQASSTRGTVQKSDDGGKTWRTISVDGATELYALSAAKSNVWVGGADGKLFHSVDDGAHWTAIPVADEDTRSTGAIISIDAHGESITVKTSSGATRTSDDGGVHWRRD